MNACLTLAAMGAYAQNPFFETWNTPFEVPPFDKIKIEHYQPALEQAMAQQKANIEAIVSDAAKPNFDNTILAYVNSNEMLDKVSSVFGCLTATDMTPQYEELEKALSPIMTSHSSDIALNEQLFAKIKAVWGSRKELTADQARLTDKIYKSFERSGANLPAADKAKLREIDQQLAIETITFANNLRTDNSAFILHITDKNELAGLPASVVASAKSEAESRKMGGWLFTLDKSSMLPFLQYSEMRNLRKKLYNGYLERGNNNNASDNKGAIAKIENLRLQRANLLGFKTHADFVLDRTMAKNPKAVYDMLGELWQPALNLAASEMKQMQALKGAPQDFQSYDWWFWAEKLRKAKYDLNEEELRPYFSLQNSINGIFTLAEKLYGITFTELTDAPKYNPENRVYEVLEADGSHLGVLYFDFHPRAGKGVGAWCTRFRGQSYKNGERVAPVVSIVCNFSKPTGNEPALLNLDEVETLFHEFGHGLHSLFADVPYKGLGGVERDFVELPSQIMENWAFEPQMLALYAAHYKTGKTIPAELAEKIANSALFNQGFNTVEYLGASLLDMDFATTDKPFGGDVPAFETSSLGRWGIMEQIAPRYRSTYFKHIFAGGYSAGYYSYIWAEVLDADAFEAFKESGDIFDTQTAAQFRTEVLSKGGSADGGVLYENFRGKAPSKTPLMKKRGLK